VGEVVVAAPPEQVEALAGGDHSVVAGGETRSESVAAALETVDSKLVVVHDAARPLVSAELIDAVIDDLLADPEAGAVVAAAPVTDTIKEVARGMEVDRTLDRSSLWAAQTPQAFRAEALRRAFASTAVLAQATDDAMLIERLGGRVLLHQAPVENLKVTTPLDLRVAELLLADR
jgi:2-C-methyl-D-erythritol 4-phosphate cytidylyltransferase